MAYTRSRSQFLLPSQPGWYPDGTGQLRYFNGQMWTEGRRPILTFTSFVASSQRRDSPLAEPRVPRRRLRKVIAVGILAMLFVGVAAQLLALVVPHSPSAELVAFQGKASRACKGSVLEIAPLSQAGARQEDRATFVAAGKLATQDDSLATSGKLAAESTWASAWASMVSAMGSYLDGKGSFATVSQHVAGVRILSAADGISGCTVQTSSLIGGAVDASR